jgi:hypothetical protein
MEDQGHALREVAARQQREKMLTVRLLGSRRPPVREAARAGGASQGYDGLESARAQDSLDDNVRR